MKFGFCVACLGTTDLHQHHLVPRKCGGTDAEINLITLCYDCHLKVHRREKHGDYDQANWYGVGSLKHVQTAKR